MKSKQVYGINMTATVPGVLMHDNIIEGNNIDGSLGYGIVLYHAETGGTTIDIARTIITNNIIKNIIGSVVNIYGKSYGSGIYLQNSRQNIVTNNNIYNVGVETNNSQLAIGGYHRKYM